MIVGTCWGIKRADVDKRRFCGIGATVRGDPGRQVKKASWDSSETSRPQRSRFPSCDARSKRWWSVEAEKGPGLAVTLAVHMHDASFSLHSHVWFRDDVSCKADRFSPSLCSLPRAWKDDAELTKPQNRSQALPPIPAAQQG